jgi:hypothetical protein
MIDRLGRIYAPLGTVRIGETTKLIVSPWAAIGTDTLLVGTSTALFFSTQSTVLKIVSAIGGAWGLTAIVLEVAKMIRDAQSPESTPFVVSPV